MERGNKFKLILTIKSNNNNDIVLESSKYIWNKMHDNNTKMDKK